MVAVVDDWFVATWLHGKYKGAANEQDKNQRKKNDSRKVLMLNEMIGL